MTKAQQALLALLAQALFDRPAPPAQIDWDEVYQEAKAQTVADIVYAAADRAQMPAEIAEAWDKNLMASMANNIRVMHDHALLHEWMHEAEIPYVILKGCVSAAYYPQPIYRAMGDVDFYVHREDLERAGAALQSKGLVWDGNDQHQSHVVYHGKKMVLEMHFNINGMPDGEAGQQLRGYFDDIFDRAEEKPIEGGTVMMPSEFHHGLILLLHTWCHLSGCGIGLRHLCDWACFVGSMDGETFRAMFEDKLKAVGLWRFARVLTDASSRYLGLPERSWATCDGDLSDTLMEDFLAGGNFGRKDNSRGAQSMLISNRKNSRIGEKGLLLQFLGSVNNYIQMNWPAARKAPVLLPLGWVYYGTRRVIRELTGKRKKTNLRQTVTAAAARREFYERLHMYERE